MHTLLLTADLMTASRVDGAARQAGTELRTVDTAENAVAACTDTPAILVIVDLTIQSLDVAALVTALKALAPPPRVVAFGPHVHESALAAARTAGCDEVLSRGQFFAQINDLFASDC